MITWEDAKQFSGLIDDAVLSFVNPDLIVYTWTNEIIVEVSISNDGDREHFFVMREFFPIPQYELPPGALDERWCVSHSADVQRVRGDGRSRTARLHLRARQSIARLHLRVFRIVD